MAEENRDGGYRRIQTLLEGVLTRYWEPIVATDFFTVEVWIRRGLQRFIVLFFIELSSRKVEIAGIAAAANGLWISQIGRNLTDAVDGILNGKRYLIHDRDPLFTAEFVSMLADVSVSAHAERFARTVKESCLERMILFREQPLRTAIHNFVDHYHTGRHHRRLANRLISPEPGHPGKAGVVERRRAPGRLSELLLPRRRLRV